MTIILTFKQAHTDSKNRGRICVWGVDAATAVIALCLTARLRPGAPVMGINFLHSNGLI